MITCAGGDCPTAVINNGLIRCTEDTGWNCELCANDLPFNLPVYQDDTLYFQFQQIDNLNTTMPPTQGWDTGGCNVYLKDCCTGEYLETGGNPQSLVFYCTEFFVGRYLEVIGGIGGYKDFQGIKIPLSLIYTDFKLQFPDSNCFYLEFVFDLSGTTEYLYTEPYEFINNCKDTIVIKSDYTTTDCDGYWYGKYATKFGVDNLFGAFFYYSNEIRIPAYLEKKGFQITKQFVGNYARTTNSQMTENWKLLTNRIPVQVATYIAKVLTGKTIYIGNGQFNAEGNISRNNEVGSQWFLEADITRINCSKSFSC
jgi:hypothetical protein